MSRKPKKRRTAVDEEYRRRGEEAERKRVAAMQAVERAMADMADFSDDHVCVYTGLEAVRVKGLALVDALVGRRLFEFSDGGTWELEVSDAFGRSEILTGVERCLRALLPEVTKALRRADAVRAAEIVMQCGTQDERREHDTKPAPEKAA